MSSLLTGKPDYGGYSEDHTHPAYPDGYLAHEQGRKFEAALHEEAVQETARRLAGLVPGSDMEAAPLAEAMRGKEAAAALLAGEHNQAEGWDQPERKQPQETSPPPMESIGGGFPCVHELPGTMSGRSTHLQQLSCAAP